jgi:hypothetical protein
VLLHFAIGRGFDDDRAAEAQDRTGHLRRSTLDEIRGDRRRAAAMSPASLSKSNST